MLIYIIWNGHFIDITAPFTNVETGNFLRALGQSAGPALFQLSNGSVTPHTNAIFMICSVTSFEIWDMLVTFYKCNILVRLAWSVLEYTFFSYITLQIIL